MYMKKKVFWLLEVIEYEPLCYHRTYRLRDNIIHTPCCYKGNRMPSSDQITCFKPKFTENFVLFASIELDPLFLIYSESTQGLGVWETSHLM